MGWYRIDWVERMNAALDYIEAHLAGEIDMAVAAGFACCSEYHFTRFFSYIAGMPLSEYIRRRRMTLAGFMLQMSSAKVIEIANMFGYDSPNSFTRAFQAAHGLSPTDARRRNTRLNSVARLYFSASVKADTRLEHRLVEEGEHTVFGISHVTRRHEAYETIPAFWDACEESRVTNRIVEAGHGDENTLLTAVISDLDDDMIKYMICMNIPRGGVPEAFETMTIPARTWAVLPLVIEKPGDSIISVWKRINTEWLPGSGFELDTGPRLERCYWKEEGKMTVEAWVPVTCGMKRMN